MNSVHEPGSRTMSKKFDSGKYRVEPGQKQAECTECTAQSQPARPARPAPACRPPRAFAPPAARPARAQRDCRRLLSTPARPLRSAPARLAACSARPRAYARPPARSARTQRLPMLYRDPGLPQAHNTVCIAIQTCCPPNCLAIQFHQQPGCLYCNTLDPFAIQYQPSKLSSLQYKNCIAIQNFFFLHKKFG